MVSGHAQHYNVLFTNPSNQTPHAVFVSQEHHLTSFRMQQICNKPKQLVKRVGSYLMLVNKEDECSINTHPQIALVLYFPFQHSYLSVDLNYYLVCTSNSNVCGLWLCLYLHFADNETKSISDHLGSGSGDWIFNAC